MTARLSASVPPDVKKTWPVSAPSARATWRRAWSSPARAVRPNRAGWMDPECLLPRYGSMASRASGRTGVVAAVVEVDGLAHERKLSGKR